MSCQKASGVSGRDSTDQFPRPIAKSFTNTRPATNPPMWAEYATPPSSADDMKPSPTCITIQMPIAT